MMERSKRIFARVRRIFIVIVLAIVMLFSVYGVYAVITPTLRLTTSIQKTVFELGEPVEMTAVLQNVGLWPMIFTYQGPLFDFIVYNGADLEIYHWGDWVIRFEWVDPISLWPTQVKTATLTWNQVEYIEGCLRQVSPEGFYRIEVFSKVNHRGEIFSIKSKSIIITIEEN